VTITWLINEEGRLLRDFRSLLEKYLFVGNQRIWW